MSQDDDFSGEFVASAEVDAGVACFVNASLLASEEKYDLAEEEFANAVLLSPQLALARYQLGCLLFLRGRASQAQLIWQPLQNLETQSVESLTLASFVEGFVALARNELNQALQHFQRGLSYGFENEPLLSDARKVMERIHLALQVHIPANGSTDSKAVQNETLGDAHVLLNAYLRF